MKKFILLAIAMITFAGISYAQEQEAKDELIIRGRILNMSQKYTKVLIIEGFKDVDTIATVHLNKKNGKFELPPLDVHKDYTIVFIHGTRVKTLYVCSAGPTAIATYFIRLHVDFDFDYPDADVLGSIEYSDKRDTFKRYNSQALKAK